MAKGTTGSRKTTTTTGSKVSSATTATSRTRSRAAAAAPAPEISLVTTAEPTVAAPMMKKRDFIDRVVALSGHKKRDVRPIVEATLRALGTTLAEGQNVNLPPLGKVKVTRVKSIPNGQVLTTRVRQNETPATSGAAGDKEALADDDD